MTRCRICGRTPEQVLEAVQAMKRAGIRVVAGFELRTRWRRTVAGFQDEVCWFCQKWASDVAEWIRARGQAA